MRLDGADAAQLLNHAKAVLQKQEQLQQRRWEDAVNNKLFTS